MRFITKTSAKAKKEKENKDCVCPECETFNIGIVKTQLKGYLHDIIEKRKEYVCYQCGCEWHTEWKRV